MDLQALVAEQRRRFAAAKLRSQQRTLTSSSPGSMKLTERLEKHKERLREMADDEGRSPAQSDGRGFGGRASLGSVQSRGKDDDSGTRKGGDVGDSSVLARNGAKSGPTPAIAVSALYGSPIIPVNAYTTAPLSSARTGSDVRDGGAYSGVAGAELGERRDERSLPLAPFDSDGASPVRDASNAFSSDQRGAHTEAKAAQSAISLDSPRGPGLSPDQLGFDAQPVATLE